MPSASQHFSSASCFITFLQPVLLRYLKQSPVLLACPEGAILAFKLSFDAAPKREIASGSNLCLLYRFIQTGCKDLH